jgi:hypothetical protein
MKVDLDLTKTNASNEISDETHTNIGASAHSLGHDRFYGSTDLRIWTGASETGTQLIENTDYTLGGIDSNLTTRSGFNVYSTVTITNVTYQSGTLYFIYRATADLIVAEDLLEIYGPDGVSYIKLNADGSISMSADQISLLTSGGGYTEVINKTTADTFIIPYTVGEPTDIPVNQVNAVRFDLSTNRLWICYAPESDVYISTRWRYIQLA